MYNRYLVFLIFVVYSHYLLAETGLNSTQKVSHSLVFQQPVASLSKGIVTAKKKSKDAKKNISGSVTVHITVAGNNSTSKLSPRGVPILSLTKKERGKL